MNTEILKFKNEEDAKKIIEDDGVVAFPTETVYGLGIRYDSFLAYNKIFSVKQRPNDKALTLMLYDKRDIKKYANIDKRVERVINKYMPGALTLVLPIKEDIDIIGCDNMIGIRIPDDVETLKFLKAVAIPMFVTSANISGDKAATTFEEVVESFDSKIELIINGQVKGGQASTVVCINDGKIELLREGPISLLDIEEEYYNE